MERIGTDTLHQFQNSFNFSGNLCYTGRSNLQECGSTTIRKRLTRSNLVMLLFPALIAGMSHDLKSPPTAICAYLRPAARF